MENSQDNALKTRIGFGDFRSLPRSSSSQTFQVKVDTSFSSSKPAPTGVLQGGCLSPVLYAIFVSDIGNYIPDGIRYYLLADDLKVINHIKSDQDVPRLQKAIDGVLEWCRENGMTISTQKCSVLNYGPFEANYHIKGEALPVNDTVRDLGVAISANLDFSAHIVTNTTAARRTISTLFRCSAVKNPSVYVRLYNAIVVPRLLYCAPVWRPFHEKHERLLKSVSNYFKRRLAYRCTNATLPDITDLTKLLDDSDLRALYSVVKDNGLEHFFNIVQTNLRSGRSVRPKCTAR